MMLFRKAFVSVRPAWTAVLVFGLVLGGCQRPGSFQAKVVGVSDGDTLVVSHDGRESRVRLHGVDAPEKVQPFGPEAKSFTEAEALGKTVTIHPRKTDRYGRIVADVLLPDGRALDEALAKAGLAWWYRRYAPDAVRLAAFEDKARADKAGLWSQTNPDPPWVFRRQARRNKEEAGRGHGG